MSPLQVTRRAAFGLAAAASRLRGPARLGPEEDRFLDDLSRRAFLYFWERASSRTGLVLDRSPNSDSTDSRTVASSAATGFGLAALCIAAARGWMPYADLRRRALAALRFYAGDSAHEHGWFYHFVDAGTGARVWNCEVSTIDTALLLAGVLAARECFPDPEISRHAEAVYRRLDWQWFLNGHPYLLSMGWKPETGFLPERWDTHSELGILYLLGIAAPFRPLAAESWYAWRRPRVNYAGRTYVSGAPMLFVHQCTQAWVDFRYRPERAPGGVDWFQNSVDATYANRAFCIDLGRSAFPGCYDEDLWGITASDSARGYVNWGGPPREGPLDGTVVPCAAAGSLMFLPSLCAATLTSMKRRFGDRIWNRYGFTDAFHPANGWTNPDVVGIDVGVTLLSAENARSGGMWKLFLQAAGVRRAMNLLF